MRQRIFLTRDILKEWFSYERSGCLTWKKSPKYDVAVGDIAGSIRKDGYWEVGFLGKSYLLHRLIFLWHHDYLPELIDHIDNNPANNCIENLRPLDKRLNTYNTQKLWAHNKSGVRGVSWCKIQNKWVVRFKQNGKYLFFGYFSSIDEAKQMRKQVEQKGGVNV